MPWFKFWVTGETDGAGAEKYEWLPKEETVEALASKARAKLEEWVDRTAVWKHTDGDVRYGLEQLAHPPVEVLKREIEAETRAKTEAMLRLRAFKAELRAVTKNRAPMLRPVPSRSNKSSRRRAS